MLTSQIYDIFKKHGCAQSFFRKVEDGKNACLSISSSGRPLLTSLIFERLEGCLLVLMPGADAAHSFARQISAFVGADNVSEFFDYDFTYTEQKRVDAKTAASRFECLQVLKNNEHKVVVACTSAIMRLLPHMADDWICALTIKTGDEIEDVDAFFEGLEARGFERTKKVKQKGEFSFQGGAIDVYPAQMQFPVRIDLFGDEVESIKRIFPSTGQTISDVDRVNIYPVCELPLDKKHLKVAFDALEAKSKTNAQMRSVKETLEDAINLAEEHLLFPHLCKKTSSFKDYAPHDVKVLVCDPSAVFMDATKLLKKVELELSGTSHRVDEFLCSLVDLNFEQNQLLTFESIMKATDSVSDAEVKILRTNVTGVEVTFEERVQDWFDAGYKVIYCDPEPTHARDVKSQFVDAGISIADVETLAEIKSHVVNFANIDMPLGFVIPSARLVLVSSNDTKGLLSTYRRARSIDITKITFPYAPGDFVVHTNFGVGKFVQIVTREIDGVRRDYMELHYAQGDKLFLPVEQVDRVTRYVGAEGDNPRLTRLNTRDWSKAVGKAKSATKKLAFDLVDVYSRRANVSGYSFEIPDAIKSKLSSTFEFDETRDQKAAIEDVFLDMQSSHVMDRLVCGDVGFGKTEVAIRAAYACVQNKKQVMLLCPTTILAQQHFETFFSRLDSLGVNVDVISRFRTKKQQNATLAAFSEGKLDVLIGTHRLLSRDVNPADLGLVIVDEEQRFGVGHKEQLKNLRETIDVLTLSATPIPRTLQMSLSGVRDMSLILTPPKKRLPVEVHVSAWDPDVVSAAIRFEFARAGQVYYVSNRVNTIDLTFERVQKIVPEANIGVAHGQMAKDELEHVMEDFAAGEIDILIATTIIESGIDNPKTNTLIIEDSHRLGLSQMYQIKGRVGRSDVQAYAYFMYPDNMPLTEEAKSRLQAIDEHQELGSGLRIAMRDLEIRGAGEMFGAEQSGNMSAVGFDLFAAMLNEAIVNEREGKSATDAGTIHVLSDIQINIGESALLSDEYIEDVAERVMIYRRVASAFTVKDVMEIVSEITSKYAEAPDEALNYFSRAMLRAFCHEKGISSISVAKGYVVVEPIELDFETVTNLRSISALYSKKQKRLKVPFHNIDAGEGKCACVLDFLSGLL